MKNAKGLLLILAVIAIAALFFIFKNGGAPSGESPQTGVQEFPNTGKGLPCPGETVERTMIDPYMRGIIEQDKPYKVIMNFYSCNNIKKGDYVLYKYSNSLEPVVRIVRGVAGDKVELTPDKKYKAWNILVNGDYIMSGNEKHFVGAETQTVMHLGLKPRKGVLGNNDLVVLSSWPPGDKDSGIFGIVNINDIIGKVELVSSAEVPKETKPTTDSKAETKEEKAPEPKEKTKPQGAPKKESKPKKVNTVNKEQS